VGTRNKSGKTDNGWQHLAPHSNSGALKTSQLIAWSLHPSADSRAWRSASAGQSANPIGNGQKIRSADRKMLTAIDIRIQNSVNVSQLSWWYIAWKVAD
jgi:hypothetical protein